MKKHLLAVLVGVLAATAIVQAQTGVMRTTTGVVYVRSITGVTLTNTTFTGQSKFADGTEAAPSMAFASTPNAGWYWSPAFGLSASIGGARQLSVANGQVIATGALTTGSTTVAGLPACNAGNIAARHFVTDATATLTAGIGAAAVGGGANPVPVVCDGVSWKIG